MMCVLPISVPVMLCTSLIGVSHLLVRDGSRPVLQGEAAALLRRGLTVGDAAAEQDEGAIQRRAVVVSHSAAVTDHATCADRPCPTTDAAAGGDGRNRRKGRQSRFEMAVQSASLSW